MVGFRVQGSQVCMWLPSNGLVYGPLRFVHFVDFESTDSGKEVCPHENHLEKPAKKMPIDLH